MQGILDESHLRLRQEVRSELERIALPIRDQIEADEDIPMEVIRRMGALGWHGIAIPREYGGRGAGHLARFLAIEEAARISGAMGGALQSAILGTAMVQYFGSEAQKRHWLPRFADGTDIISICVTEPSSGSHILGMKTQAVRDGDHYVLDGVKCWIANSHLATVHGVIARTGNGSDGLSAFLVEADRPGVRPGVANDSTGLRGFNIGEVIFEKCRIPAANRIALEGMGLQIAHRSITCYGKPNLTAVALGVHQSLFETTRDYAEERTIYGHPLSDLESAKTTLGEIYTNLSMARQAAYWAMHVLDLQGNADEEIILAKLVGTEWAFESAKKAMDIFAARGTSRAMRVERFLRDVLMVFPPAGTSDVHRKRMAEIALGRYVHSSSEPPAAPRRTEAA